MEIIKLEELHLYRFIEVMLNIRKTFAICPTRRQLFPMYPRKVSATDIIYAAQRKASKRKRRKPLSKITRPQLTAQIKEIAIGLRF